MIELGSEVKDSVTGFKGIAVARTEWLNGCNRVSVQPKIDRNGICPEPVTFDEPQLTVMSRKKVKRSKKDTGGPLPIKLTQNIAPK